MILGAVSKPAGTHLDMHQSVMRAVGVLTMVGTAGLVAMAYRLPNRQFHEEGA